MRPGDLVVFHLLGLRAPTSSLDNDLAPAVDQCVGLALPAPGPPVTRWPGLIAYAATAGKGGFELPSVVYAARAGAAPRRVRSWPKGSVKAIAVSHDGSQVAVGIREFSGFFELWVMSAAGRDLRRLATGWDVNGLDWSPDGSMIAATASAPPDIGGRGHVLVVDVAGGAVHDLTPHSVSTSFPVWVPNRHDLLSFAVAPNDNSAPNAVGVISASGAGFQRVTSFGAQYMAWYANPHRGFLFEAQLGMYGTVGTRTTVVQHCRAAFSCGDMEPLTLLEGDRLVGFVTTFANNRAPEVDLAPVTPGTAKRVLVESYGACCTAWWPGPSR